MRPGRVEIRIGEVVFDGLGPLDRDAVGRAMETELARLAHAPGLTRPPVARVEIAAGAGGEIRVSPSSDETRIGASVARSVFRALNAASRGRAAP